MAHIRYLKDHGAFNAGETGSIEESEAAKLVARGVVELLPLKLAAALAINPSSEEFDAKKFHDAHAANDAAAAATARITGKTSYPSVNGYDVASEK
jgi:predicted nucleic acid-binding protein